MTGSQSLPPLPRLLAEVGNARRALEAATMAALELGLADQASKLAEMYATTTALAQRLNR